MAVINKTLICNMALTSIGDKTIEAITEDSAGGRQCAAWYDYSRLQALESYSWNFAQKRLTLSSHADDPPPGVWAFRYQYPSDCVIIRRLQNPILASASDEKGLTESDQADAIPFDIELGDDGETKSILTNLSSAIAVYTFDVESVNLFTPYFVRLFVAALAGNIAIALTGKTELEDRMFIRFQALQEQAPAINANEQMKPPPRDADWVRGR